MSVGWHPHPDVWFLVAVLLGGYWYALRYVAPSRVHPAERAVTRRQVVSYLAGVLTLWLSADWPVHELAESRLYSVHMVQHLVMAYVAPPLLLLGAPPWMLRWLIGTGPLREVVRVVTRPAVALVVFNIVLALIHVPVVVAAMLRSEAIHFGFHALVVLASLAMWMPVLSRLIEFPRLSYPGRMGYLFLQSLVPTVPASFLTFGDTVLYRFYETVPRIWGLSALTDQQIAGLIMKIGGGFLLWGIIGWYFFRWVSVEEREGVDVLGWQKVERDLDRVELTKP